MKYFLALVLGCAPLAGLTAWSLVEATTSGAQVSAFDNTLDLNAIKNELEKQAVERKDPPFDELAADNPLENKRPNKLRDALQNTLPSEWQDTLANEWTASDRARQLLRQLVEANSGDFEKPPTSLEQVRDTLERLKRFLDDDGSMALKPPDGAQDLFNRLTRYRGQLEEKLGALTRDERLKLAIKEAHDQFKRREYAKCLASLQQDPLTRRGDMDDATLEDLALLGRRAEFHDAWNRIGWNPAGKLDESSARNRRAAITGFLQRFPSAPSADDGDIIQEAQGAIELLDSRLKVLDLLADLKRASTDDLDSLVERAVAVLASNAAQDYEKAEIRRRLKDWIKLNAFPKIEAPDSLQGKQEAVTAAGTRKLGIFLLPVPGATQYYFWNDAEHKASPALRKGEEQISVSALLTPPATPQYLVWANEYQASVDALLDGGSTTKDDWERFAEECQRRQEQLVAYREKWGVGQEPDRSCRDWSFKRAAQTARQIARHWNEFQQVLNQF